MRTMQKPAVMNPAEAKQNVDMEEAHVAYPSPPRYCCSQGIHAVLYIL